MKERKRIVIDIGDGKRFEVWIQIEDLKRYSPETLANVYMTPVFGNIQALLEDGRL